MALKIQVQAAPVIYILYISSGLKQSNRVQLLFINLINFFMEFVFF
jgi:hypothetical protein